MIEPFKIKIGRTELAGERSGMGKPIVFLHVGVANKRMWYPQITALNDHIAYDRRGFGETTTANATANEAFSHVEDLRAVLDQLGIANGALIGCSQGG